MKDKKLTEGFERLEEFVNRVNQIVSPVSFRDELKSVLNKTTRKNMCEKFPKCFIPINMQNKENFMLPVCNRNGAVDPNMINFSLKLTNRLYDKKHINDGMLQVSIRKLKRLHSVYSKDIPKPPEMAAKKAKITNHFKQLKNDIQKMRGNVV